MDMSLEIRNSELVEKIEETIRKLENIFSDGIVIIENRDKYEIVNLKPEFHSEKKCGSGYTFNLNKIPDNTDYLIIDSTIYSFDKLKKYIDEIVINLKLTEPDKYLDILFQKEVELNLVRNENSIIDANRELTYMETINKQKTEIEELKEEIQMLEKSHSIKISHLESEHKEEIHELHNNYKRMYLQISKQFSPNQILYEKIRKLEESNKILQEKANINKCDEHDEKLSEAYSSIDALYKNNSHLEKRNVELFSQLQQKIKEFEELEKKFKDVTNILNT